MNAGPPLGWILGAPATVNSTVNPSPSLPDGKLPCAHVAHLASVLYHKHRTQTASRPVESLFSFRFFALLDRVPLSLPNFCDFARLPWIFCDPLRSMVAPRQRERMNSLHKTSGQTLGEVRLARDLGSAREIRIVSGYARTALGRWSRDDQFKPASIGPNRLRSDPARVESAAHAGAPCRLW